MISKMKFLVLVLVLLCSLAINIATVTVQSVALGVSGLVGAVAGTSAVLPQFRTVTIKGQKRLISEAVKETTGRVARRTTAGASRNVASTFGEAIPVVGIAVVVGATALELKDACDTMTDLHELELAIDPSKANAEEVSEVCGLKVPTKEEIWTKVKASPGEAWAKAKAAMPDLPEMPDMSGAWDKLIEGMPEVHMPNMSDAWGNMKEAMPDMPKMPDLPKMPKVKWKFWGQE